MPLYIIVLWLEHIQNLHFFHQISIKFSYIFWCLILGLIFWVFGATWGQKGRFWEPLGAQLGPKWRPKSAKWRPKSAKWPQKGDKTRLWQVMAFISIWMCLTHRTTMYKGILVVGAYYDKIKKLIKKWLGGLFFRFLVAFVRFLADFCAP